jgi:hypothetical protein
MPRNTIFVLVIIMFLVGGLYNDSNESTWCQLDDRQMISESIWKEAVIP